MTVGREGPLEEVTFQMRLYNFRVKINCTHCILLFQKAPLKSYERGFKKINPQGYEEQEKGHEKQVLEAWRR